MGRKTQYCEDQFFPTLYIDSIYIYIIYIYIIQYYIYNLNPQNLFYECQNTESKAIMESQKSQNNSHSVEGEK